MVSLVIGMGGSDGLCCCCDGACAKPVIAAGCITRKVIRAFTDNKDVSLLFIADFLLNPISSKIHLELSQTSQLPQALRRFSPFRSLFSTNDRSLNRYFVCTRKTATLLKTTKIFHQTIRSSLINVEITFIGKDVGD